MAESTVPPENKKRKLCTRDPSTTVLGGDAVEVMKVQETDKKVSSGGDRAIYTFDCDLGRMGNVSGTFLQEIQKVENAKRNEYTVYFGEILGKHSDIQLYVSELDLTQVTKDEKLVNAFEEILSLAGITHFGYNPFDYFEDAEDEGEAEEEEEEEEDE